MPPVRLPVPRLLRRLLHRISRDGLLTAVRRQLSRAAPPLDPYPQHTPPAIHPFDLTHGVSTSGYLHGEHLHASGRGALWATAYYAIAPSAFHAALAALEPHLPGQTAETFTFVDLGCGRGRALLLAAEYPFAHILGVELDPTLAGTARANLAAFRSPVQLCPSLEVRTGDAATLAWPLTPLVVYLYNPFLAPVLRRVLAALEQTLAHLPRPVFLLYLNPEPASTLDRHPRLAELHHSTLPLAPADQLADRLGSTSEDLRIFRLLPG